MANNKELLGAMDYTSFNDDFLKLNELHGINLSIGELQKLHHVLVTNLSTCKDTTDWDILSRALTTAGDLADILFKNVDYFRRNKAAYEELEGIFFAITVAFIFCAVLCGHSFAMALNSSPGVYLVIPASPYSKIEELPKCALKSQLRSAAAFFGIPLGLVIISSLRRKYSFPNELLFGNLSSPDEIEVTGENGVRPAAEAIPDLNQIT